MSLELDYLGLKIGVGQETRKLRGQFEHAPNSKPGGARPYSLSAWVLILANLHNFGPVWPKWPYNKSDVFGGVI